MIFTDDDLKRLKETEQWNESIINRLLARLEAAEAILNHAWDTGAYPPIPDLRWTTWRKAAGK